MCGEAGEGSVPGSLGNEDHPANAILDAQDSNEVRISCGNDTSTVPIRLVEGQRGVDGPSPVIGM